MSWNINNSNYNLEKFKNTHPGGIDIIDKLKNQEDITALFETYHAFSNKQKIYEILEKYKIEPTNIIEPTNQKKFDFKNYNELLKIIKEKFPNKNSIKSTLKSYIKNVLLIILYFFTLKTSLIENNFNIYYKCLFSFISGMLAISIGFNVLHDSSHYASSSNILVNNLLSKITNSWLLWNHNIWFFHHIYKHHSFTSIKDKDPDLYYLRPFVKIVSNDLGTKKYFTKYQHYIVSFISIVMPGMCTGQSLLYLTGFLKKKLLKTKLPNILYYSPIEIIIMLLHIYVIFYNIKNAILPILIYYFSCNLFYHINIIFDHDTFSTHVTNNYDGDDWLKLQISNSGNFLNNQSNLFDYLWTELFGGINYQIEHHLFPNMANEHYKTISPIVKKYCIEHDLPYSVQNSLFSGYKEYLKTIKYHST
jgi:linoleoyl-CoA desaturase